MRFFLRNISLSAFILALIVGSISIYISGRIVYGAMLNQVFKERVQVVQVLGRVALEEESIGTSTSSHLQTLVAEMSKDSPGLLTLRIVNAQNRAVLASADETEIGTGIEEEFPELKRGLVSVELDRIGETSILELAYLGSNGRFVWMQIDEKFFVNPAVVAGFQQGAVFAAAFGLFAFLFFGIVRKFFTHPVRRLKEVLSTAEGSPKEQKQKSPTKESFGELLESFSDVAARVESTIEHDKVVSETKSDFISTTAHQLRTPLSGINWALGALLSNGGNLSDEQKNLLERALEKTKELVTIVGELLSAAGIEQGKFGFHPEEVELKGEIEQTIAEEKELASKNKVTLRFEHEDEVYPVVYVDRERVRWVIRNLIENAIRYGREGGEVLVTLKREGKKLLISVKDNGIGISPQAQQHIFEKFFRSAEAKQKRNDGSGIGLFIVRNIVNYHGGRIWFESVEGVGTTFFFTIPIAREAGKNAAKELAPPQTEKQEKPKESTEKQAATPPDTSPTEEVAQDT